MDSTAKKEKEKYERVWACKAYRRISPGEISVDHFLSFNPKGKTLVDLGCGTGRAGQKLSELFDVTLFDHVDANETTLPFVQGCLWEDIPKADIGYCCDVLEHIPTEKVYAVLDNLSQYKELYIRIHLKDDNFGHKLNTKLHLTVKPFEWWLDKIQQRFENVIPLDDYPNATFYSTH